MGSIDSRWENVLRIWLLRFYNKTTNLEIRPMLANVIADNFNSIDEIDWKMLSKYPEFAGHTDKTLVKAFSGFLHNASRSLKIDKFDLTFKQVATFVEAKYTNPKVDKIKEKRKKDIIEYFENAVKE